MGEEPAYEAGTSSTVEAFDSARDFSAEHPAVLRGTPQIGPNVWPEAELGPGYRDTVTEYYEASGEVSADVFAALGALLGEDRSFFASR